MVFMNKKEHRMWLMMPFVAFFIIALSIYFFRLKRQRTAMNHKAPKKQTVMVESKMAQHPGVGA